MNGGKQKTISIIIPVLNEEKFIAPLLEYLHSNTTKNTVKELIVVDGGSTDRTSSIATSLGATVIHSHKGRARQMNLGAKYASGDILYFLHVDTLPPKTFEQDIIAAIDSRSQAGCFRMQFDSTSLFLRCFAWFSRINFLVCRGGDQSLYITKLLFQETKGFNEDYMIYEDNEFIGRLYRNTCFTILPQSVETSARKYHEIGMARLQYHFGMIHLKNYMGAGPEKLYDYYRKNIIV